VARCPEVAAVEALVRAAAGTAPEFRELATGLVQDRPAVEAALTTEWSNGQVAGQVNKLKLVKRAMYGRAGFPLLRRRVLRAA
jgi:transposase